MIYITIQAKDSTGHAENVGFIMADNAAPEKPDLKLYNGICFPRENGFLKLPFRIILGPITVEASTIDKESGIDRVEFYVGTQLMETKLGEKGPYRWEWNEWSFGIKKLSVKAYDKVGHCASSDILVIKIF